MIVAYFAIMTIDWGTTPILSVGVIKRPLTPRAGITRTPGIAVFGVFLEKRR